MGTSIMIPGRFVEEARRRGFELEDIVLMALAEILEIDPSEVARLRLEMAEKMLKGAEEHISRGDVVRASEKLYKTVEGCIKALAERLGVSQLEEVRRGKRWDTWLLGMVSTDLSKILREERISLAWSKAYEIHVWGFHEAKYRIEDVEAALPLARWLLEYTKRIVEGGTG